MFICVFISSNGEIHKNEEKLSFSGGRALSSRGQIKRIFFFFKDKMKRILTLDKH